MKTFIISLLLFTSFNVNAIEFTEKENQSFEEIREFAKNISFIKHSQNIPIICRSRQCIISTDESSRTFTSAIVFYMGDFDYVIYLDKDNISFAKLRNYIIKS
jgi:alpha-N-acetylglucosamine transferase